MKEALKLADLIQHFDSNDESLPLELLKEISATLRALAQTQEPVAHWSDCAVHSEPAYPKGECDCGGIVAVADYTALSDKYVALSDKYVALKAQRTWQGLTDEEIAQGCKESWVAEQAWQSAVWWAEEKLKEKNGA